MLNFNTVFCKYLILRQQPNHYIMKKILSFSVLLMLVVLAGVLSAGRKKPDLWTPPCEDLQPRTGKIQINFTANGGNHPFRKSAYQGYIPDPDLRWNDACGCSVSDQGEYYCLVTVTSSQCSAYQWQRAMDDDNSNGNIMTIQLPPSGYNAIIKVEYYERGEDNGTPDFNQDLPGYPYSRVKYQFQQTFQGWPSSNIAQPIYLNPAQNVPYVAGSPNPWGKGIEFDCTNGMLDWDLGFN
jgi:hypothetical protein